jgi:hypothetical protein
MSKGDVVVEVVGMSKRIRLDAVAGRRNAEHSVYVALYSMFGFIERWIGL